MTAPDIKGRHACGDIRSLVFPLPKHTGKSAPVKAINASDRPLRQRQPSPHPAAITTKAIMASGKIKQLLFQLPKFKGKSTTTKITPVKGETENLLWH